ncbi:MULTISPECIES: glycoside hydrolase family 32 protein [Pontibacillus]|uniref:Glycoside hydrolase family 32 protein n=1 Tax=Pontibacillus chungwhensis TaxID=265426 RepID=A0ABY8V1Q0_9BACI|nr:MULTISPECIES: glycoside hydrolase family 32 protein [Pontibacillus]MCD5322130.1 glycoside hydrolase family 32 protein [Pontibacillus sp. HN14]WIF99428.1 glycoside hydrolase family 32 protein [Pontibacillus chungwhensis]
MTKMKQLLISGVVILVLIVAVSIWYVLQKDEPDTIEETSKATNASYDEPWRPQFHYTPAENWMNDPNGMVYYKGKYHLFYQHNPKGDQFGHMSWGHAVSEDLVHWKELDVAMTPDENGMIFSGSVVVDDDNTSGLFPEDEGGLIAYYTNAGDVQDQRLAYSTDEGKTWTKYEEGNPVVPNPGIKDFRDPVVMWHEETEKWVMLLVAGDKVMFYESENLVDWSYSSEFGAEHGAHGGVWETPELFELAVDGDSDNKKWVLQVDMNPGSIAGGSGSQYFIGDFDGKEFKLDPDQTETKWTDYGKDFYATQAFNNMDRVVWIAWMSNWQYAADIPTSPWRGAMSIPREVSLTTNDRGEMLLTQQPIEELQNLRGEKLMEMENRTLNGTMAMPEFDQSSYEIVATFRVDEANEFGFKVAEGEGEETIVGYDDRNNYLFTDRNNSGKTDFHPEFGGVYRAPMEAMNGYTIKLHIYVDESSVEVFGNNGQKVLTNQIFPTEGSDGLSIYSYGGTVKIESLEVYDMKSMHE